MWQPLQEVLSFNEASTWLVETSPLGSSHSALLGWGAPPLPSHVLGVWHPDDNRSDWDRWVAASGRPRIVADDIGDSQSRLTFKTRSVKAAEMIRRQFADIVAERAVRS